MKEYVVESLIPEGKGKYKISFEHGLTCNVYRTECKEYSLREGAILTELQFDQLMTDGIGKRAKKRAMHLLEQMDRSEAKLREKLSQSGYPDECVDAAIDYVKSYHYLDDFRYACTYVRYHGDKISRQQLLQKLLQKGVTRSDAISAIEEEYCGDEMDQILALLRKKNYDSSVKDDKEFKRIYSFLLRRGFKSSDILKAMKSDICVEYYD